MPATKPPEPNFDAAVYAWVRGVRRGQVTTYGRVATALGSPRAARAVGYALARLNADDHVPWWRVINARGEISVGGVLHRPELQRRLLEAEGVALDADGRVDLACRLDRRGAGAPQVVTAALARQRR